MRSVHLMSLGGQALFFGLLEFYAGVGGGVRGRGRGGGVPFRFILKSVSLKNVESCQGNQYDKYPVYPIYHHNIFAAMKYPCKENATSSVSNKKIIWNIIFKCVNFHFKNTLHVRFKLRNLVKHCETRC